MRAYIFSIFLAAAFAADNPTDIVWEEVGRHAPELSQLPDASALSILDITPGSTEIEEVRMIGLNSYLGDNLIFRFPLIAGFRHTFPNARLEITQHYAALIAKNRKTRIRPTPMVLTEADINILKFVTSRNARGLIARLKPVQELVEYIRSADSKKTLTYFDLAGLKETLLKQLYVPIGESQTILIYEELRGYLRDVLFSLNSRVIYRESGELLFELQAPESLPAAKARVAKWEEILIGIDDRPFATQDDTLYELTELMRKLILGNRVLPGAREIFNPLMANATAWKKFTRATWPRKKPLILINFNNGKRSHNTFHAYRHSEFIQDLLPAILSRYDANIGLLPVDPNGIMDLDRPDTIRELQTSEVDLQLALEKSPFREQVGLLPLVRQDGGLVNRAVKEAAVVISVDGGFVHVANLLNDPNKVITYSIDAASKHWRAKGQPFFRSKERETSKFTDGILGKLQEVVSEHAPELKPKSPAACFGFNVLLQLMKER